MKEIASLDQSTRIKGKRKFVLRDDGFLHVSSNHEGRKQEFAIEAWNLNPEPIYDKRRATGMIVGMAIFGLAFLGIAIGCIIGQEWFGIVLGSLFLLPFSMCLVSYLKQSYDVVIFQTPGGQIAFLNNVPSPESFSSFVASLREAIKSRRDQITGVNKSLSQEIEELANLHKKGVLNDAEFAEAKKNLINSAKPPVPIGFG